MKTERLPRENAKISPLRHRPVVDVDLCFARYRCCWSHLVRSLCGCGLVVCWRCCRRGAAGRLLCHHTKQQNVRNFELACVVFCSRCRCRHHRCCCCVCCAAL